MAAATTGFGLFKTRAEAETAVRVLEDAGYTGDQVGLLGPGEEHDEKYGRNLAAGLAGAGGAGGSCLVAVTGGDVVAAEAILNEHGAFDAAPIETPPPGSGSELS